MEDEMLENKCELIFKCGHTFSNPCRLFLTGLKGKCKYCHADDHHCLSAVANINRMILEAVSMGVKLKPETG
jgi:hypothetical protein